MSRQPGELRGQRICNVIADLIDLFNHVNSRIHHRT